MAEFLRNLTPKEIDYIIYGIDKEKLREYKLTKNEDLKQNLPLYRMRPNSTNPCVVESYFNNMNILREQLKKVKLYLPEDRKDELLEKFRIMITKKYIKSLIAPGTNVGIQAADALGAPITQITLNSFHNSGKRANSTTGIERMKEILHATKNMRARVGKIFFKEPPKTFKEALDYRKKLVDVKIMDLIDKDSEILAYDDFITFIKDNNKEWIFEKTFPNYKLDIYKLYVGVYKLDKYKMYIYNITMKNISKAIKSNVILDKAEIVYSDVYDPYIFIFYDSTKNTNHGIANKNACFMFLSDFIYKKIFNILIFKPNDIKKLFVSEVSKTLDLPWINKDPSYVGDKPNMMYYAETEGINLLNVLGHGFVDSERTFSNDPQQIKEVLGIEAARYSICDEIQNVIKEAGDISIRHTLLLVDYMTYMGTITPISIIGSTSKDEGTLLAASRLKATETIASSAVINAYDIKTPTVEIAFGSVPDVGTRTMGMYIDNEFKRENIMDKTLKVPDKTENEVSFEKTEFDNLESFENQNVEFVIPKPKVTINTGNYNINKLLSILKESEYDECNL